MDHASTLDRLEELLALERDAIRRLDGATVEATAREKLTLVQGLASLPRPKGPEVAQRLAKVVGQLRRNGVLLVHAKAILADVLRARGAAVPIGAGRFAIKGAMQGGRISVRG
jgi:hypothetical protein